MAGSLTNVLIIGTVIFAIAMIIPIFFDVDFPQRGQTLNLVDKALCTIFPNGGGNYTCTVPDDQVFFNSTNPSLVITANDTLRTVFFQLNSTGDSTTASNLGNGSEVFANQVFDNLEFRTLTSDGSGISIAQNPSELDFSLNNILIDALSACGDQEILQWQTGGSEWVCVSPTSVGSNVTDTDEDVQVKEGGSNVGVPRHVNFVDSNDFIILEDVGNNEIDIAINRDGAFGFPSLDSTGKMAWTKLNFTLSDIHDLANVQSTGCTSGQILKWNSTTTKFECEVDEIGTTGGLNSLTDVTITSVSNFNILMYNTTTSQWENVTPNEALANFFACSNNQVLKYNSGTSTWVCTTLVDNTVKFAILTAGGATLQTPASSTPNRDTEAGTNFDYLALEYDATTSEEAIWQYQLPTDADTSQNIVVLVRFLTPTGSAGGVCFTGSFLGRTNTETYDVAMGTAITTCNTSLDTAGDINQVTLTFTTGQHGLAAGDTVIFKLARATANGSDTHGGDAWYIDSRVTWS